jgi:hypothetical protein
MPRTGIGSYSFLSYREIIKQINSFSQRVGFLFSKWKDLMWRQKADEK